MFENDPVSGRRKSRSPSDSNEGFDKFFRCYRTLIRVIWLQLGFRWQFVLNFSRELYARLKICVTWSQRKLEYRFVLNFLDFGEWFSLQVEILEHFERLMEGFCYSTCQWNLSQPPNLIVGKSPKQCTICTWPRSNDTKTWRNIRTTCIVITFTLASRSSRLNQAPPPTQRAQRAN